MRGLGHSHPFFDVSWLCCAELNKHDAMIGLYASNVCATPMLLLVLGGMHLMRTKMPSTHVAQKVESQSFAHCP